MSAKNWIEERNDTEMLDSPSSKLWSRTFAGYSFAGYSFCSHPENHVAPKQATMSRRCIMPNKVSLRLKWNTSLFVKIKRQREGVDARQHAGQNFGAHS